MPLGFGSFDGRCMTSAVFSDSNILSTYVKNNERDNITKIKPMNELVSSTKEYTAFQNSCAISQPVFKRSSICNTSISTQDEAFSYIINSDKRKQFTQQDLSLVSQGYSGSNAKGQRILFSNENNVSYLQYGHMNAVFSTKNGINLIRAKNQLYLPNKTNNAICSLGEKMQTA